MRKVSNDFFEQFKLFARLNRKKCEKIYLQFELFSSNIRTVNVENPLISPVSLEG